MDELDEWHIRGNDTDSHVMIADKDGCPVAERVYRFDAEWIVEQRRAATAPRRPAADGEGQSDT